jgi:hypothetical protein
MTYNNGPDGFSILGWYLRCSYRQLSELVLDGKVEAVEGLIVDMVAGGLGFATTQRHFCRSFRMAVCG